MKRSIRTATTSDAATLRSIYGLFVEATPISFEVDPPTIAEMAKRVETTLQ